MADERVWLHNSETGGYFHCPAEAVEDWAELGWQPSDPPDEPNPVVAERIAWEAERAPEQGQPPEEPEEPAQQESITAAAGPRPEIEE
jgi:hypothetical protein